MFFFAIYDVSKEEYSEFLENLNIEIDKQIFINNSLKKLVWVEKVYWITKKHLKDKLYEVTDQVPIDEAIKLNSITQLYQEILLENYYETNTTLLVMLIKNRHLLSNIFAADPLYGCSTIYVSKIQNKSITGIYLLNRKTS